MNDLSVLTIKRFSSVSISERIEFQALGRAGRKGKKGSGQIFLLSNKDSKTLENERAINE